MRGVIFYEKLLSRGRMGLRWPHRSSFEANNESSLTKCEISHVSQNCIDIEVDVNNDLK